MHYACVYRTSEEHIFIKHLVDCRPLVATNFYHVLHAVDCKTVVFFHFRKARSAVSVIFACEAREPHTPVGPVRRGTTLAPDLSFEYYFTVSPAFAKNTTVLQSIHADLYLFAVRQMSKCFIQIGVQKVKSNSNKRVH